MAFRYVSFLFFFFFDCWEAGCGGGGEACQEGIGGVWESCQTDGGLTHGDEGEVKKKLGRKSLRLLWSSKNVSAKAMVSP